jgi:hypothetical protein
MLYMKSTYNFNLPKNNKSWAWWHMHVFLPLGSECIEAGEMSSQPSWAFIEL